MNQSILRPEQFFFGTRSLPCPYVEGRVERKVVTDLSGDAGASMYERLSRAGFRRSHNLAYRPACPGCMACVPVRVRAGDFEMDRTFRRVWKGNSDLAAAESPARATTEQFRLFARYQADRHAEGEMASMAFNDFRAMVEDTPVDSRLVEFRDAQGTLVATMLGDYMEDSLSAVYSFFEPGLKRRGLGTFMILWLIERARQMDLPFVYLGYWIENSDKMSYKSRFRPLERLGKDGWRQI